KANFPPYVIEPPDVLLIGATRLVPRPPYKLEPLDAVLVVFPADPGALTQEELEALQRTGRTFSSVFTIEPEGTINLGKNVGKVRIADLTVEQAQEAVEKRLMQVIKKNLVLAGKVTVELAQIRGMQQVAGDHLVRQDGTISLGTYGSVNVTGLTLEEAKAKIEEQLSKFLLNPSVSVDVSGYNSRVYYVIFDAGGNGQQITRQPATGNETVLDAIAQVSGLPPVSSKTLIWIARPSHGPNTSDEIIPVDWDAISRCACSAKNYQIFPGDRVYVAAQPLITVNNAIERIVAPIERLIGVVLLGKTTADVFRTGAANLFTGVPGTGIGGTGSIIGVR